MKRTIALLTSLVVLAAGCSGGGDDDGTAAEPERTETTAEDAVDGVDPAPGGDAEAVAAAWLETYEGLDDEGRESLRPTRTVQGRRVTHVHFGQSFDDIPVRGAELIVHVGEDGSVLGASSSATDARPPEGVEQQVDEGQARDIATKAIPSDIVREGSADVVWLQDGDRLRLGWSVTASVDGGAYRVWVDAVTGEVADAKPISPSLGERHRQTGGGCDLEDVEAPAGCVFLPDPLFAAGSTDREEVLAEADDFLSAEPLLGLDDPESGVLVGEFANAASDLDPEPFEDDDGVFDQGRGEPGFEAVMSYYWLDRTQRLIQDLGFDDVRNESFAIIPVSPEAENNAFYNPVDQVILMGVGPEDGINEGEDASGIIHEYGHAVLDQQVPGLLGEEGGAYHEAFGDLLAVLSTIELRQGDPACLFMWTDSVCLRRVDTDKVFPDDVTPEVHDDSEIYSGAVFDVFEGLLEGEGTSLADCAGSDACDAVRDRVLTTLIASNGFLTARAGLEDVAAAYFAANEAEFDGADADLIAEAFADHGLDVEGAGETIDPDGETTGTPPTVAVAVDIRHPFRGDLAVELRVVDGDFEDLCEPVVLAEPSNDDGEDLVGRVDLSDSDCAELVPPAPDQRWVLSVIDTEAEDEGVVNAFKVFDGGTTFLATGVPVPVPDDDPDGIQLVVDAGGEEVEQEGTEEVEEGTSTETAAIALSITHPFVGDLSVRAGVADADGTPICVVPVLSPDPDDDTDDLSGVIDMSECAELLPPGPDQRWFVDVVDTAAVDEGAIDRFTVLGPDGEVLADFDGLPTDIPDDDPAGLRLALG